MCDSLEDLSHSGKIHRDQIATHDQVRAVLPVAETAQRRADDEIEIEVDFGEFWVWLGRVWTKAWMFVMRLSASRRSSIGHRSP